MLYCEVKLQKDGYDGVWGRTVRLPFDRVPVAGELVDMDGLPSNVPASDGGPAPTGHYVVLSVVWTPGYHASMATLVCGRRTR